MRLIEVLPNYEAKRFDKPPVLTQDERKSCFQIDLSISSMIGKTKQDINKVGLLLQYGYFKVTGKFFTSKTFKSSDIKAAAKIIGVIPPKDFMHQYTDRTRQKHRLFILTNTGFLPFNNKIDFFEESITDMVDKQMHPRKLFYALIEQLRQKKIELPSYDRIARTITDKFHAFEAKVTKNIAEVISSKQQEALEKLVSKEGEP